MTGALIRKELGELKPWAILSVVLGLAGLAEQLLRPVDMRPLEQAIDELHAMGARVSWLIAFAIGTGLATRESEDGTLAFLDGLPIARTRVFFVKCALAWALLSIEPWISLGSLLSSHYLSHGSLDQALRPDIVLARFALHLAAIASGLSLGTALGWLRSLTWLCVGLLSTGLSLLIDRVPQAAMLSPFALLDAPISSAPYRFDSRTVLVQVALTLLSGTLGWAAFLRAGKGPVRLDLRGRPVLGAVVAAITLTALGIALVKHVAPLLPSKEQRAAILDEQPRFDPGPPAQTATRHYRFSYPAASSQAALALAARADALYEQAHELLAVPHGGSIDVDGSGSRENTDGTAYYGRVRISLVADDPPAVLLHETTHVIARRLAGDDRAWLWQKAAVLDEGLATWVTRRLEQSAGPRRAGRLVLAALHARAELRMDELVEPARLALMRDDNLKYPAGEAIIEAIVRLYGSRALPRLVRAFGTPTLPADLRGAELWQATFQLSALDLGKVVDEVFRELTKELEARRDEIAALPRLRLRLVRGPRGMVGVQVFVEPESASVGRLLLRFKPEPDAPLEDLETEPTRPEAVIWRVSSEIMNGQVCAQAGLPIPPDQTLYEPWVCLPVADAERFVEE